MNKKIIAAALAVAAVCAAGIISWIALKGTEVRSPQAEIYIDGSLYRTYDLAVDADFIVTTQHGFNSIRVSDGCISVYDADCPDGVCIRTGAISGGAVPIICLPHRLEVRIVSGEDVIDAQIK